MGADISSRHVIHLHQYLDMATKPFKLGVGGHLQIKITHRHHPEIALVVVFDVRTLKITMSGLPHPPPTIDHKVITDVTPPLVAMTPSNDFESFGSACP